MVYGKSLQITGVEAWEVAQPNYQLGEIGDLNNVRFTGYLILVFAVFIIFGGIKYVSRLGTLFLMVVLFVILCMYVGCLMGPTDGRPATYTVPIVAENGTTYQKTLTWTGPSAASFEDNLRSAWDAPQLAFPKDTTEYSFVNMMGLYFPSVTGIMAGANRSADLADPTKAIPKGTLFAQLFTTFIYLSFIFVFGSVAPRETLLNDKFFASTSAFPVKEVVIYGVMASSLGAGLNSLVSGTKLLSAIAGDGTLPILRVFKATPGKEPRLALLASGALCALSITIGELNAIAPLLTMFFLMCYTCVNMSCTILHFVSDPNWRPTFRYHHWSISLIAAALCVWMMFAMAAVIAMAAIAFCSIILAYAAYNSANTKWGDGFQGMKFQLAKNILISMDAKLHTKNWRPQLLVVTEPKMRSLSSYEGSALVFPDLGILKTASQLKNGRGFIVLGSIVTGGKGKTLSQGGLFLSERMADQVAEGNAEVKDLLRKYMIDGFGKVVYSDDFANALADLVQSGGMGAFEPNCLLASWPKDALALGREGVERRSKLVNMVQISAIFQKVMILTKGLEWPEFEERLTGNIDIWWIVGDGGVLLLLPSLLKKHRVWSGCHIRLFVLADRAGDDVDQMQHELDTYVRDFRLQIEVFIKVVDDVVEGVSRNDSHFVHPPPDDPVPSEFDLETGAFQNDMPKRITSGQSLQAMKWLTAKVEAHLERILQSNMDASAASDRRIRDALQLWSVLDLQQELCEEKGAAAMPTALTAEHGSPPKDWPFVPFAVRAAWTVRANTRDRASGSDHLSERPERREAQGNSASVPALAPPGQSLVLAVPEAGYGSGVKEEPFDMPGSMVPLLFQGEGAPVLPVPVPMAPPVLPAFPTALPPVLPRPLPLPIPVPSTATAPVLPAPPVAPVAPPVAAPVPVTALVAPPRVVPPKYGSVGFSKSTAPVFAKRPGPGIATTGVKLEEDLPLASKSAALPSRPVAVHGEKVETLERGLGVQRSFGVVEPPLVMKSEQLWAPPVASSGKGKGWKRRGKVLEDAFARPVKRRT
ncbi:unnamed protein product [Durusdinium trenchii]|uniref:Uncharacterized protein n=1 Tax=Durusdinium trenchii TaxID=1381693 RepID=A0ABP0I8F0_9DINO